MSISLLDWYCSELRTQSHPGKRGKSASRIRRGFWTSQNVDICQRFWTVTLDLTFTIPNRYMYMRDSVIDW